MQAEVYKLTSYNGNGDPVETYVLPGAKRFTAKAMAEEYGNVEETALSFADLPPEVKFPQAD